MTKIEEPFPLDEQGEQTEPESIPPQESSLDDVIRSIRKKLTERTANYLRKVATQARQGNLPSIKALIEHYRLEPDARIKWLYLGIQHEPDQNQKRTYYRKLRKILFRKNDFQQFCKVTLPLAMELNLSDGTKEIHVILKRHGGKKTIKNLAKKFMPRNPTLAHYILTLSYLDVIEEAEGQKRTSTQLERTKAEAATAAEETINAYLQSKQLRLPLIKVITALLKGKKEASAEALCLAVIEEERSTREIGQAHLLLAYIYAEYSQYKNLDEAQKINFQNASREHARLGADLVQTAEIQRIRPTSVASALPLITEAEALDPAA